jgi:hypothetical protein
VACKIAQPPKLTQWIGKTSVIGGQSAPGVSTPAIGWQYGIAPRPEQDRPFECAIALGEIRPTDGSTGPPSPGAGIGLQPLHCGFGF